MEGDTSMPQNGRQQISSSATVDSPGTSTNGINQVATPNIPSTPNSEITPASNNSAGTSHGQSSGPNEDPEILAAPNTISDNQDLESGTDARNRPSDGYLPLLLAALKGDWLEAQAFYNRDNECVRASITITNATALHIAVGAHQTDFIKKWLPLMSPGDLELQNESGSTALHLAAQVGDVSVAELLRVEENIKLLSIPDNDGDTPLIVAAFVGHTDMVSYLLPRSRTSFDQLNEEKRIELLHHTIHNDMYDIALKILEMDPNIANANNGRWWQVLETLAKKPFSIANERKLSFWKRPLNSCFKGICHKALTKTSAHQFVEFFLKNDVIKDGLSSPNLVDKIMALIFEAVKVGNVGFLIILSRSNPSLIWQRDTNNMSIFHTAILHRQESVFNLIYELGAGMYSLASYATIDKNKNMLHLAGKLAPSDRLNIVSGAALQMQRELLWFKEIEKIIPQSYLKKKNEKNKTPKEIFTKKHKDLKIDGEKWMKDTANHCMLVATLIATVIFAAAFTVPGGNNQVTGISVLFGEKGLMVFFISDAIALCSSSTSIVFFLSILTSRYTEDDFLKSLPSKLLFGLATLFISMAFMMVAFIATFFLVYTRGWAWTAGVVITSASIPIISFGWLHRKIWVDTFRSTYKSRFLFRPHKHRLFLAEDASWTIDHPKIRNGRQTKRNKSCRRFTRC